MKLRHCSGTSSSGKMASTGHGSTHAPQSMHSSGSMKYMFAASSVWMQSTGQTSTHEASLTSMQGWTMTYATCRKGTMHRYMPESEPKPRLIELVAPGAGQGWKAVLKSGKPAVVHEIPVP